MNLEKFINISWYMERKPYGISTATDIFYLRICREIFGIIDKLANNYEDVDLEKEDCREMAYSLTAYFEDQVSEIGFWKSLTELNKKQFGKRLPFFDEETLNQQETDHEDILPADIHYLAYISYLNILTLENEKPVIPFNSPFLLELTNNVFNYFEKKDEILVNESYTSFLKPEADFIEFKQQSSWFTLKSYLTGIEFFRKFNEHTQRLIAEGADRSQLPGLMYAEQDRLLFEVPSTLTAFFPIDIFAGAMRCNEMKKREISNLKRRPHGIFHIQAETAFHYRFLHTSTGEEFDVLKSSFSNPVDWNEHEYWITTLAQWNNDYYVSGMCLQSPYVGEEIYHQNLKMQQTFQKHFPEYRRQVEEIALKYRNEAQSFFGSDLVVFDTGHQLQKKLNEFNQWYFDKMADKSKLTKEAKAVVFNLPPGTLASKDIAIFIPPTDGLQFVPNHQFTLDLLQTNEPGELSPLDIEDVLMMLSDENVGTDYWNYLHKNFPIPNLSLFLQCPLNSDEDFDALLRIYLPQDFSPLKLPRFSTFTSERISPEKVQEVFYNQRKKERTD